MLDADLDLEVQYPDGRVLCRSTSYDSSWEACEWYGGGTNVVVKVRKYTTNAASTYFGIAWYSWTTPDD